MARAFALRAADRARVVARPCGNFIKSRFPLFAGDGHALDANRGRSNRAAKFEVTRDLRDAAEHLPQIAGDGDFFDRKRELAVFDPQAARAFGKISSDHVDTVSKKFGDIEAVFDAADDLFSSL